MLLSEVLLENKKELFILLKKKTVLWIHQYIYYIYHKDIKFYYSTKQNLVVLFFCFFLNDCPKKINILKICPILSHNLVRKEIFLGHKHFFCNKLQKTFTLKMWELYVRKIQVSFLSFLPLKNASFLQAYLVQILLQNFFFMVHLAVSQVWFDGLSLYVQF